MRQYSNIVAIPDMIATMIAPPLSSKGEYSNNEHTTNTMETVYDSIFINKSFCEPLKLNTVTIMAILIMLYSPRMVHIVADDLIHQICLRYDVILITIFLPFSVLINCELTMAWLCIIIQCIIKWMMIYQLIPAVYNSCHAMTTRTCVITTPRKTMFGQQWSMYRTCNRILFRVVSITAGCAVLDVGFVRQGVVIYMSHLVDGIPDDSQDFNQRVYNCANSSIDTLSPSYDVQYAIDDSLVYLIRKLVLKLREKEYIIQMLTQGTTFPARKGAAIGIASIVRRLSIPSVSRLGIMDKLGNVVNDQNICIGVQNSIITNACCNG